MINLYTGRTKQKQQQPQQLEKSKCFVIIPTKASSNTNRERINEQKVRKKE